MKRMMIVSVLAIFLISTVGCSGMSRKTKGFAIGSGTGAAIGVPAGLTFPKGALVVSMIRGEEVIIPAGDSVIQPEDRVIILSTRQGSPQVEKALTVKLEYF